MQYQISLLEENRLRLNKKLIRKSTEIDDLLSSVRNKEVQKCLDQFNDVICMFIAVDKE